MLTTTSKYALRLLVELGRVETPDFVLGRTLADRTSIPRNYLAKVLTALRNADLVETVRGRNGGYRLGREAATIRLIEVVEIFEGIRSHPSCLLDVGAECSDADPCPAHAAFKPVRAAYIAFLEGTSLADIDRRHLEVLQ